MLASLFGSASHRNRRHGDRSPFSSPYTAHQTSPETPRSHRRLQRRRIAADYDDTDITEEEDDALHEEEEDVGDEDGGEDEGNLGESTPLLPIFSAAHLGIPPCASLIESRS